MVRFYHAYSNCVRRHSSQVSVRCPQTQPGHRRRRRLCWLEAHQQGMFLSRLRNETGSNPTIHTLLSPLTWTPHLPKIPSRAFTAIRLCRRSCAGLTLRSTTTPYSKNQAAAVSHPGYDGYVAWESYDATQCARRCDEQDGCNAISL